MYFGQLIIVAACLLGSACYGGIALLALCISIAAVPRRVARAVAAMAGLMTVAGLILAALSTLVPASSAGDDIADILLVVWLALFLAGLGLIIWSGVRAHHPAAKPP